MKKFLLLLVTIACFTILIVKQQDKSDDILYLLNWGDYMDGEIIKDFEKEFNCEVKEILSESNEDMYNQIVNNKYPIDVVIPSDYMVQKLKNENLLIKLETDALTNFHENIFDNKLQEQMDNYDPTLKDYCVPYFWGTVGLMYNDRTPGLEDAVRKHGLDILFNNTLTSSDLRIGMYNNPRDAIAFAEIYLGYSLNTTNDDELKACKNLLLKQKDDFKNVKYAGDELKNDIAGGKNLDIAVCYSGDFFDQLYTILEEERDQYINFYVPDKTNVYFDAMVIPVTSKQTVLAREFINFFLDTDIACRNVDYVGYCPTVAKAYDKLLEQEFYQDLVSKYPFHPMKSIDGRNIEGEMYQDLGDVFFQKLDQIYREVASK